MANPPISMRHLTTRSSVYFEDRSSKETTQNDQEALFYYDQALNQIESIFEIDIDTDGLKYDIFLHISDLYQRKLEESCARVFIEAALVVACKLKDRTMINECLNRQHIISNIYNYEERYDIALSIFEKSLAVVGPVLEENHYLIAKIYKFMASIYDREGKSYDAILMYEKSIIIASLTHSLSDADIATTYDELGYAYERQGRYDDALSMYQESLQTDLSELGNDHPRIALIYIEIGSIYCLKNKYDDAIAIYQKALKIQLSILDDNHPDIARVYSKMGFVYDRDGKPNEAFLMYQKASSILDKISTKCDYSLSDIYNKLADCYDQQNRHTEAKATRKKSRRFLQLHKLGKIYKVSFTHPNISQGINSLKLTRFIAYLIFFCLFTVMMYFYFNILNIKSCAYM